MKPMRETFFARCASAGKQRAKSEALKKLSAKSKVLSAVPLLTSDF